MKLPQEVDLNFWQSTKASWNDLKIPHLFSLLFRKNSYIFYITQTTEWGILNNIKSHKVLKVLLKAAPSSFVCPRETNAKRQSVLNKTTTCAHPPAVRGPVVTSGVPTSLS